MTVTVAASAGVPRTRPPAVANLAATLPAPDVDPGGEWRSVLVQRYGVVLQFVPLLCRTVELGATAEAAPVLDALRQLPELLEARATKRVPAGYLDADVARLDVVPSDGGAGWSSPRSGRRGPSSAPRTCSACWSSSTSASVAGTSSLRPEVIISDTGSYSDMVFGLLRLPGFDYRPQLADLPDAKLWRIDATADYGPLSTAARGRIDLSRIRQRWDDILRLVASIHTGAVSACACPARSVPRWTAGCGRVIASPRPGPSTSGGSKTWSASSCP